MIRVLCLLSALLLTPAVQADAPLLVNVVSARSVSDTRTDTLVGEIVARNTLIASFPTGGRIASVEVEEGDNVEAGTVLARMESVQQQQSLRAAEAGVATATADFHQAQADLERQSALLERGATTRIARDTAEDAVAISEGTQAQAQAVLDQAQKAMNDTVLLAPEAGSITDRMVEPGQVVGAAQPVLELALGTELDALFDVPETMLTSHVKPDSLRLALLNAPETEFSGDVREVSPLVDATTGTVEVTISATGAPAWTSYGDAVRGTVQRQVDDHIVLPFAAMSATRDGPAVWVVDPANGTVSLRQITIDRFETERIIVRDGLDEGTLIVTDGAQLMYPGRPVIFEEPAK
ncbi:efflux RND transporter periplasmic adaptor subunit [Puniceibacterium sp. IMCC21224]|uniref:efflux RND transporter periplasmic adaptor subunit n=1 Tax=Puniceibacterium sp. IMCC21224 TaxID=1618204 RepID=UPI00065D5EC6|nr:efflux RND transporter periplasmic adaptor subunit [Puniceibacterium sp. IMCC21224]KMK65618.1 RND family efflux transporter, MFP subunit [Puniceibacterium sp. IMCC21224]